MGSLNGTVLNTEVISFEDRRVGESHVLHSDAVMELGSVTQIQVKCAPTPDTSNPKRARVGSTTNQVYAPSRLDSLPTKTGASATPRVQLPPHVDIATLSAMSLHIAVHQRIGADHQRINTPTEDVVLWDGHFTPFPSSGLFCVFDGHQGPNAAALAKKILPEVLRSTFAQSTEDAGGDRSTSSTPGGLVTGLPEAVQRKCLTKVFLETDEKMAADEGCTATALLVERTAEGGLAMQSANVGDSSVLLVNVSSKKWEKLTQDHRISTSASERARLEKRGHFVKSRLYGLNISRMLGDKFLKDEDLGFLAEPYISAPARVPPGEACFIVLASDGLWDVITEQRASALVIKAEDLGFLAEPYISAPARVPPVQACFIVLASDGLWDVITEQRAYALVVKACFIVLASDGLWDVITEQRASALVVKACFIVLASDGLWDVITEQRASALVVKACFIVLASDGLWDVITEQRASALVVKACFIVLASDGLWDVITEQRASALVVKACFLVLASDGLWDVITEQRASALVVKDEDLGFLAEPYISAPLERPQCRRALSFLLAGLWDVITEQQASALVIKAYEEDPGLTAAALADIMLEQAITHRSRDDISVVVLKSLA
eukprot:gene3753-13814_t